MLARAVSPPQACRGSDTAWAEPLSDTGAHSDTDRDRSVSGYGNPSGKGPSRRKGCSAPPDSSRQGNLTEPPEEALIWKRGGLSYSRPESRTNERNHPKAEFS